MYKILFIDEDKDFHDIFRDYFESVDTESKFKIETSFPSCNLRKMLHAIHEINPDAIIVDFFLNNIKRYVEYNIEYNGIELCKEILNLKEKFPCFVITSYSTDAIHSAEDVNLIYEKSILNIASEDVQKFAARVEQQIISYSSKIKSAEITLKDLIKKSNREELDVGEESLLIELDSFLEKALNKRTRVPDELKKSSCLSKVIELMDMTENLLKEIKKNDKTV